MTKNLKLYILDITWLVILYKKLFVLVFEVEAAATEDK